MGGSVVGGVVAGGGGGVVDGWKLKSKFNLFHMLSW